MTNISRRRFLGTLLASTAVSALDIGSPDFSTDNMIIKSTISWGRCYVHPRFAAAVESTIMMPPTYAMSYLPSVPFPKWVWQ